MYRSQEFFDQKWKPQLNLHAQTAETGHMAELPNPLQKSNLKSIEIKRKNFGNQKIMSEIKRGNFRNQKNNSRNQTDKFWKSKNHLRNQKRKNFGNQKIISEIKRTNCRN